MATERIFVVGAGGQIGTELVEKLRETYGVDSILAADIKRASNAVKENGLYEDLDVLDAERLLHLVKKYNVKQIYLLAALLSATAEQKVKSAWKLNMDGLFNVLDLAKEGLINKVYWPSSIAVFGPSTPRVNTPQQTIMEPNTVYGISKLAGERWCEYYHQKFGVDVRSLRYPGLIGYKSDPGGGTTDYAVTIFHEALKTGAYECFLSENTYLPMMYMPDAIRATIGIMEASSKDVKIRNSYNLAGMSFSPKELSAEISKNIPDFKISYKPDSRQKIADSWPASIDDSAANADWGWKTEFDLPRMVTDMILNLKKIEPSVVL
jgi:nucleoside-diphosphate-sugar epimerase